MFCFKNHAENEAGRLVPDTFFFFFFKKVLYKVKTTWSAAWFRHISIVFKLAYNKYKLYKTLRLLI